MTNKEKFLNLVDNSIPPMYPKNIPTSDLRKGNLVLTEYGVMPVHNMAWDSVWVQGIDGRILYARKVEGVKINFALIEDSSLICFCKVWMREFNLKDMHELQNFYYWFHDKQELKIKI